VLYFIYDYSFEIMFDKCKIVMILLVEIMKNIDQ
jgi:hypothetical protein